MKRLKIILKVFKAALWIAFNTLAVLCALWLLTVLMRGLHELYTYRDYAKKVVEESNTESFRSEETSFVYDSKKNIIAKLKLDKDTQYLEFEEIPDTVRNCFVAVEDRAFWEHNGIDLKGIVRVGLQYVKSGGTEVHGASTITQQLARNIFLTHEVSIDRKLKEIFISCELEKKYSKKEIMEFYVNSIFYANGYYGIEAAAQGYFGKSAKDLSISQTALLCGIPNNPSAYNPITNLDRALLRRDKIVKDLYSEGFITEEEKKEALKEKITIIPQETIEQDDMSSFAINCAIKSFMSMNNFQFRYEFASMKDYEEYNKEYNNAYTNAKYKLLSGGYEVYTSLDPDVQNTLQKNLDDALAFSTEVEDGVLALQGAATVVDNETGNVIAVVGGRTATEGNVRGSLNRAFQSHRQPGSTIKPVIVYAPALEHGYTPDTTVNDSKQENGPENSGGYSGSIPLRIAVEKSKNTVAWQVFESIGPKTGLSYAQAMNFSQIVPDDYYLSASLGGLTYGVTTVEMASAYSTLANDGIYRDATCITSIKKDDKEYFSKAEDKQVYTTNAAEQMIDVLKGVLIRGTAASLHWDQEKMPAAGKTGTTNSSKDGWFCGTTPYYSIAVWVGYDKPRSLKGLWGATYPATIWNTTMNELILDKPYKDFIVTNQENESTTEEEVISEPVWGSEEWFAQHDDSEEISPNYTVGNLKQDTALAAEVDVLINDMLTCSPANEEERVRALDDYVNALDKINSIYGVTKKQEYLNKLNSSYEQYSSNY